MSNFNGIDERLKKNREHFEHLINHLEFSGQGEMAALLAQRAATFATYRHTGLYASSSLESKLLSIAVAIAKPEPRISGAEPKSTLHILSRAFSGGGHTRVVERWIQAVDREERHSVLLTRGGKVTDLIEAVVQEHGGRVYKLKTFSRLTKRASLIRQIAQNYSRVVLHVHMDDVLPTLAFGGNWFEGKITHFNHADHRFWVGSGLPNRVIEMRSWGKELSVAKRGLIDSDVVGIPLPLGLKQRAEQLELWKLRLDLGLPKTSKIILSVGQSRKYVEGSKTNFPRTVRLLIEHDPNRVLVCVGQKPPQSQFWKKLVRDFPTQLVFVPEVPLERLHQFILAADLGLDSFPMSGGTAVLEMLSLGLPVLSLKCETGHFDVIAQSSFFCNDEEVWLQRAEKILGGETDSLKLEISDVLAKCREAYGSEVWAHALDAMASEPSGPLTDFSGKGSKDLEALDRYLIVSTPKIAKLFF